jgi:Flp pilus assembly protein TadD
MLGMPTNEEMYDEAIGLQQQGDLEKAVAKLQELLEQDANYALAHAALSVFYEKMERHDEAVEHAQKVCELEPKDPFSFVAMSLICQKAGRLSEAEQALMDARQAQFAALQNRPE